MLACTALFAPTALCGISFKFTSTVAVSVINLITARKTFSAAGTFKPPPWCWPLGQVRALQPICMAECTATEYTLIGFSVATQAAAEAAAAAADARVAQLRGALQSVTSEFRAEVVALEEAASLERRSHTHRLATALAEARQQAAAAADAAAEVGAALASFMPICTECQPRLAIRQIVLSLPVTSLGITHWSFKWFLRTVLVVSERKAVTC